MTKEKYINDNFSSFQKKIKNGSSCDGSDTNAIAYVYGSFNADTYDCGYGGFVKVNGTKQFLWGWMM